MRYATLLLTSLALQHDLNTPSAAISKPLVQRDTPPLRLLRSDTPSDEEERKAINLPGINKLTDAAKWTTTKISDKTMLGVMRFKGKTADEAFLLLKLDQAGDKLLESKEFGMWVSYMTKINKKHPKTAMVTTLTARYGDEGLAKMLEAGRWVEATSKIAGKLQIAQMKGWLQNKKSMDDVFKILTLDKGVDNILTNQNLNALGTYVNLYNKKYPGQETSVIKELMVFHGDEAVSKMLEAAKKVPETHTLAKALQTAQFKLWFVEGAKPFQIWKMLNMKKETWMMNPDAQVWRGYLEYYKLQKAANVPK
ncbi:hypothetical protein F443_00438 [Phytophthora nicotianae P1569]|uniref:RxLR effector protein n=1 Tax=Phytophthora nicotianae P1569 TaxID=1317065 RepID=V9G2U2_PHYNI|nr:hypothetical protein F443_00438 [Phytophthora nicotianae P1569]